MLQQKEIGKCPICERALIDGPIDGAFIRSMMPDWEARLAKEKLLLPAEIA